MQNNTLSFLQSQDSYGNMSKLVKRIEEGDTTLLDNTFSELKLIIAGEHSPEVHLQSLRLIKELFLLGKQDIIKKIEQGILPKLLRIVENNSPPNHNPETYFNNRPEYLSTDERGRELIRRQSVQYINHCLESIRTWSQWIKFTAEGYRSVFSERYDQLTMSGVKFPVDRTLYKQIDKEKFEKIYKMQFFNSESEFQDSLLNESNYQSVVMRELAQCNQIVETLRIEIKPTQQQTNWKRVKHLIQRAAIFFHEQSVRLIQQLKNIPNQSEYLQKLLQTQSMFGRLIQDYQFHKAKKMPYPQFFKAFTEFLRDYGVLTNKRQLSPEQHIKREAPLGSPQTHHIVQVQPVSVQLAQALKGNMKKRPLNSVAEPQMITGSVDREREQLMFTTHQAEPNKQEYKAQLEQVKQEYQSKLQTQREYADRRVQQIKKLVNVNSTELKDQWMKRIDSDNEQFRKQYDQLLQQMKDKELTINQLSRQVRSLQSQLASKNDQLQQQNQVHHRVVDELGRLKRLTAQHEQTISMMRIHHNDINKDKQMRNSIENRSVRQSLSNASDTMTRKLQKRTENLQQEVIILKEQLEIERKKQYRQGDMEMQLLKDENARLKQLIGRLEDKETNQRLKIDVLEVQNLKLQQSLKIKASISDTLKKENEWMTKTMQLPADTTIVRSLEQSIAKSRSGPFNSTQRKLSIREYLDATLEGDTYYQQLTREFKVHFRRACFKRKELLFKQANIELGVITEKKSPDHINCSIFITNYGGKDMRELRIKILNPSVNQISCEGSHFEILPQGQQQKVYIDTHVQSYPMGPFILKISFIEDDRDISMQLLLPITIIKLVTYQNRHPTLINPQRLVFRFDHKVLNSSNNIQQYFPGVTFITHPDNSQLAHMTVEHNHSQTTFHMDLHKSTDNIEIGYALERGREEIMRYYVRILAALLEK